MSELTSHKLACVAARALDNKKAGNINILDIGNVSVISDYFVVCSADTSTQVRALSGHVRACIKKLYDRIPTGEENDIRNRWHLVDYGDVVIHILHKEEREMYAIEKFWNHASQISEETWLAETEDLNEELM